MNSSFPDRWSFSYPNSTKTRHTHNRRTKAQTRTARTSNSKEQQQKYRPGTVGIKTLAAGGGGGRGERGNRPHGTLRSIVLCIGIIIRFSSVFKRNKIPAITEVSVTVVKSSIGLFSSVMGCHNMRW